MASSTNVILKHGESSCEIALFGGNILSWKSSESSPNHLFLSTKAVLDGSKPIRGGVPLVFPAFGSSRAFPTMPSHGFARISTWTLLEKHDSWCVLGLKSSPATMELWPHVFELRYRVELGKDELTYSLLVHNVDDKAFSCQALLHTYVQVPDIHQLRVEGLDEPVYLDQVKQQIEKVPAGPIIIDREVDWITSNRLSEAKAELVFASEAPRALGSVVGVSSEMTLDHPFHLFVVVWNPWIEKSKKMADFDDAEYEKMICIEPGALGADVLTARGAPGYQLLPEMSFTLSQKLRLLRA